MLDEREQSEPREASGIRESNLVLYKGVVIWRIYPISSTVVAEGLCQPDRKMKPLNLLLLPPAFGGLWESVQGYPWRVGNANSRNHI